MPTEIWKAVTIREFKGEYKISESGRLKRKGRFAKTKGHWIPEKFISATKHGKKVYLRVGLSKNGYSKHFYIHRLVALRFVPNPEGKPDINHKDGNKLNNHFTNLEWCTPQENNKHAKELGLFYGANSKIPKDQRRYIQQNFFKVGRTKLAEMFGLTEDYVLSVAKVKVNGTSERKKSVPRYKRVIDTETGKEYTTKELAEFLRTKVKYIYRMLGEERKPNTSQYRYA